MLFGRQNFFHAEHPTQVVGYSDISRAFHKSGEFCREIPGVGMLKVRYRDVLGKPDAPVALLIHGYRGDPDGPNNRVFAYIMQRAGFATVKIGFAGYDHYGQGRMPQKADKATIPSQITDVRMVLDAIDLNRKVIVFSNCGSINVAVPAVSGFPNVTHIATVSPLPNVTSVIKNHIKARKLSMGDEGFVISPDNPAWKVTASMVGAGQPVNLLNFASLNVMQTKPRLMVVRSDDDSVAKGMLVTRWLDVSSAAGYEIEDYALRGDSHAPTDAIFAAFGQQVQFIAQDLGLGEPA